MRPCKHAYLSTRQSADAYPSTRGGRAHRLADPFPFRPLAPLRAAKKEGLCTAKREPTPARARACADHLNGLGDAHRLEPRYSHHAHASPPPIRPSRSPGCIPSQAPSGPSSQSRQANTILGADSMDTRRLSVWAGLACQAASLVHGCMGTHLRSPGLLSSPSEPVPVSLSLAGNGGKTGNCRVKRVAQSAPTRRLP